MFLQWFLYFFKCHLLLNNKPTVQLFFKRECKTSGCTAQFFQHLFSTPINNIIRFASHAVTMRHMEDGILEQSILKPVFEIVDISGI